MQELINWTVLSHHLAGARTAVRKNYHPKKYKKQIELLLYYVDCWEKGIELGNMEHLKEKIKEKLNEI